MNGTILVIKVESLYQYNMTHPAMTAVFKQYCLLNIVKWYWALIYSYFLYYDSMSYEDFHIKMASKCHKTKRKFFTFFIIDFDYKIKIVRKYWLYLYLPWNRRELARQASQFFLYLRLVNKFFQQCSWIVTWILKNMMSDSVTLNLWCLI